MSEIVLDNQIGLVVQTDDYNHIVGKIKFTTFPMQNEKYFSFVMEDERIYVDRFSDDCYAVFDGMECEAICEKKNGVLFLKDVRNIKNTKEYAVLWGMLSEKRPKIIFDVCGRVAEFSLKDGECLIALTMDSGKTINCIYDRSIFANELLTVFENKNCRFILCLEQENIYIFDCEEKIDAV